MKHVKKTFGVDLTTLVTAQNSLVPTVVRMCVDEIETRGTTTCIVHIMAYVIVYTSRLATLTISLTPVRFHSSFKTYFFYKFEISTTVDCYYPPDYLHGLLVCILVSVLNRLFFIFRPPVRSNGRSYKMLVMFLFFQHVISELHRPITAKLRHMIRTYVSIL